MFQYYIILKNEKSRKIKNANNLFISYEISFKT